MRFFLFLCFFLANAARAEEAKLFFHWQNPEGNSELLRLGQGSAQIGADGLGTGSSAQLNEQVFSKIREWYKKSGNADAAGSGFYMAEDLFSSRAFGNDLVVVEVKAKTKIPVNIESYSSLKLKSDALVGSARETEVPFINRYYTGQDWHVVPRPPTAAEAKEIEFSFRRPSAEDTKRIWDQYKSQKIAIPLLDKVAQEVIHQQARGVRLTPTAEAALHRLLFDEGPAVLQANEFAEALKADSKVSFSQFTNILRAYEKVLPADPRTMALQGEIVKALVQSDFKILQKAEVELFLKAAQSLSETERKKAATWALTHVSPKSLGSNLKSWLEFLRLAESSDPASIPTLNRWKNFFGLLTDRKSNPPLSVPDRETYDSLSKMFGVEKANKLALSEIEYVVGNLSDLAAANRKTLALGNMSDYLEGKVSLFLDIQAQKAESFPAEAEKLISSLWKKETSSSGPAVFNASMGFLEKCVDPSPCGAFKGVFHRILPHFENDPELKLATLIESYLGDTLEHHGKSDAFLRRLAYIYETFPGEGHQVAVALADLSNRLHWKVTDPPIEWNRLIAEAKMKAGVVSRAKMSADAALGNVKWNFQRSESPFDEAGYRERVRRAIETIPGSEKYSELARTFSLVDPAFVFEDVRINNASRPFQRFNETFTQNGATITQPAWENFNQAWDDTAASLEIVKPLNKLKRKDFWENFASDAQQTLLVTNVEGRVQTGFSVGHDWDRKQYTTNISDADWQHYGLAESRKDLERFFTVQKVDNGFELKFLDESEIAKKVPGIGRYTKGTYTFAMKLERFILADSARIKDPVQRAARLLYLYPRLHPYPNGNGRKARLLASVELAREGLVIPVGLPTNDFMMSQAQIDLELRKALLLGKFWQKMLLSAHEQRIDPADFFQKVYRGSDLEAICLYSPSNREELAQYVKWLSSLDALPAWAKNWAKAVEGKMQQLHAEGKTFAKLDENQRAQLVEMEWKKFHAANPGLIPASISSTPCAKSFAAVARGLRKAKTGN